MFSIPTGIRPENFKQIEQELVELRDFHQTSSIRA